MLFVMAFVTCKGTEMIVGCGEGGEDGCLIRVIFGFTPNEVSDSDGVVRHESAEVRKECLIL
jgi:hypothetical protein